MEERRFFLALILSLLVIFSWYRWVSKFYHIEKQELTEINPSFTLSLSEPEKEEKINWFKNEIIFEPSLGTINKIIFKEFQNYEFILKEGFLLRLNNLNLKNFYEDKEKKIIKEFNFSNHNYCIDLRIKFQNLTSSPLLIKPELVLLTLPSTGSLETRFWEVALKQELNIFRTSPSKNFLLKEVEILAFRNQYFCMIIESKDLQKFTAFINKANKEIGIIPQIEIPENQEKELNFLIYIGPQDLEKITSLNKEWNFVLYYGFFNSISKGILYLLRFFYKIFQNWGIALIILSIFIYFLLYPLTFKQISSLKKIQKLQPQIEELKRNYKNNPQRLNKEILELYKKEGINPFGGCLPLILQIPIFFALYQALMRAWELKGKSFLWIKDLSKPDEIIIFGKSIHLLPLILILVMFIQQKRSQIITSSEREQQKLITL
ncbi:MAG: YidC/Oxa1 family insertase periplasmic-domain containing protein, partial [Candidatus Omnitrophica bacterium]|nr:YidC/Oxa1 family insertase periplasmic-domain containing protein [Candidatus Omnitrophota bacterium]